MSTFPRTDSDRFLIIVLGVALALVAALAYLLIALKLLAVADVPVDAESSGIIYVAAASYLIGGLLILARNRWLWVVGAVFNALVIVYFFQLYQNRPAVVFSPGGVISKAAQLLLELTLLYLIVSDWRRSRRQPG